MIGGEPGELRRWDVKAPSLLGEVLKERFGIGIECKGGRLSILGDEALRGSVLSPSGGGVCEGVEFVFGVGEERIELDPPGGARGRPRERGLLRGERGLAGRRGARLEPLVDRVRLRGRRIGDPLVRGTGFV